MKNYTKKSYVTLVVLIIMFVLLSALYLFAESMLAELAIARNNKGSAIAFSLADAGVQEAIYRIQNDPTTRNTFLNTVAGTTTFSHTPALINNGDYSITIQNSARAVATISAVGNYHMGLRTAKREIKVRITQATNPPPYTDDAALYSHSAGGESTGDFEFDDANIIVYSGSIASGRDIKFDDSTATIENGIKAERTITVDDSTINCNCLISDDGNPLTPQCGDSPGCSFTTTPAGEMPLIDFDSSSPNSYKNRAIALNQYYSSQSDFFSQTGFNSGISKTFNGVVYVDGSLNIDSTRTMIMNGVIATSGTISVGRVSGGSANGTLTINNPGTGQPSGVLSQHDFIVNRQGNFSATGLIYTGTKVDFQNSTNAIDLTGGILARRIIVNNRTLIIHFDSQIINDTLDNPTTTPVIEISHWEEEY